MTKGRKVSVQTIERAVSMYRWMLEYDQENGYVPTIRAAGMWLAQTYQSSSTPSVAKWYWQLMTDFGWITTAPHQPRTLQLLQTESEVLAHAAQMGVELPAAKSLQEERLCGLLKGGKMLTAAVKDDLGAVKVYAYARAGVLTISGHDTTNQKVHEARYYNAERHFGALLLALARNWREVVA